MSSTAGIMIASVLSLRREQPKKSQIYDRRHGSSVGDSTSWKRQYSRSYLPAPSQMPDAFAAVTTPSFLNTGRSAAIFSSDTGRGCSSVSTVFERTLIRNAIQRNKQERGRDYQYRYHGSPGEREMRCPNQGYSMKQVSGVGPQRNSPLKP